MALVLKDRVKETTTVVGTGTATLLGAATGYQSFAAIGNGNTCYYTIAAQTANEWEVGIGTYTSSGTTLSRDTVLASSNSGNLVNFSAGTKDVFVTQPAEKAVYGDATGLIEAFGNGTNTISFTDINTSNLTANTVTLTSGTISTAPNAATDIVNKTYVDSIVATGIHYHEPVLVESPTALTATYNQPGGAGNGVGATLTNSGANVALVIDGVTLSNTARVLVYTQANAVQNGIYTVTNEGAPDTPGPGSQWVLTRATDADTYGIAGSDVLGEGSAVFVQSGDTGAGESYVCNTNGTITFGTTNITFAQISSAQIYSAGTGLSLTNLTFSIADTAVTPATYGNAGAVATFTVNAQGQITNAANTSINASSITLGTLDNARTTASSSNGANTIVLRDSTGSFAANTITVTTANATTFNGTTGAFTDVSGNGSALTAINASNISSGTIANARTTANTANSANTIVARDADGSFGANIITATFSGNGASLTSINASNISSGTIANARTTASSSNGASTIVQRDSGGNFTANTVTAAVIGDLSGGSAINASNISSGTIANARTTASSSNGASTIVLRGASGEFAAGAITGSLFTGNGSAISAINASNISTGTIDNARTTAASANGASTIVARDSGGNFAANTITATTFSGAHSGNGAGLTDINASNISSGTIANARTTASSSNGANTIVLRDASGNFTANAGTFTSVSGNGVALTAINASNVTSGTLDNARTSASASNGANTIVSRDAGGNFAAATITATTFSGAFSGNGAAISAINASNISTGTIANARTTAASANGASTIVARDAGGNFAAATITATTFSGAFSGNGSAISAINASNISTGTIDNARTTAASANGASTIVARDANGSFAGNVITGTTGTFTNISGNGSALSAINASNIASGTIANARTTAATANGASTIVLRGTSGEFSAGAITSVSISGNGAALTDINASNISSGTIANARTTAASANGASTIVARDASGNFTANAITTTSISGNGVALTAINASNIASGTLNVARGGTGATTLTAENVIIGNGTSAVKFVAPGATGNVLRSNGSAWTSSAPSVGINWQSVKTSDFTAVAGEGYPVNTTSSVITATLPATPSAGESITFVDYAGTWDTNRLYLQLNGAKLNGSTIAQFVSPTERGAISLVYIDSTQGWITFSGYSGTPSYSNAVIADFLVVAGAGAGGYGAVGSWVGGGGGAGGYREFSSQILVQATNYTVTVGAGGTAGTVPTSGSNSVFNTITSAGGGRGGGNSTNTQRAGADGGSGGGGAFNAGGAGNTPATSPSQGNNGGSSGGTGDQRGGGGGGAGGVGQSGDTGGGLGGVGTASSITGTSVTRAAGGRGGLFGSASSEPAGGANTGNGGGGAGSNAGSGNNGGSGVVIIKYPDIFTITNPGGGLTFSTSSSGGFKVTTFTAGTGNIQFN